jgi:parvulin-like peptidyl-prolyl isomerase
MTTKVSARRPFSQRSFYLKILILVASLLAAGLFGCSDEPKTVSKDKAPAPAAGDPAASAPTAKEALNSASPSENAEDKAPDDDAPVAFVNGQPIDVFALNSQVARLLYSSPFANNPDETLNPLNPPVELRLEVLDQLVNLEIAHQAAVKDGFSPKTDEVDKAVGQIAANYGGNLNELENTLSSFGDSLDRLKKQVAYNQAIKNWRDTAFLGQAAVSESEAKAFYEEFKEDADHPDQIRALQIIFPIPLAAAGDKEAERKAIREKAEAALKEAKAGAKFEDLIAKYMNANSRSLTNDGVMGWVAKDGGNPELEEALFTLSPGQISEVVETPFSFHVLKALEFRPAGRFTFEELKPDILEFLTNEKIDKAVSELVRTLRSSAKIEIKDPEIAKAWPDYERRQKENAIADKADEDLSGDSPDPKSSDPKTKVEPKAAPSAGDAK